jgi:hypothetical protein
VSGLAGPGPGPFALSLSDDGFYVLVGVLGLFVAILVILAVRYPGRRRGLEGYFEAAGVSLAFLVFSVGLVAWLVWHDPHGNRTSLALYRVVLNGYWLAFAIPVVTVGSSIQSRSRGSIPWFWPSVAIALGMFGVFFGFYYAYP